MAMRGRIVKGQDNRLPASRASYFSNKFKKAIAEETMRLLGGVPRKDAELRGQLDTRTTATKNRGKCLSVLVFLFVSSVRRIHKLLSFLSIAEGRIKMSFMLDWGSGKQNFVLNSGPNNAQSNPFGPSFPQSTNNNSFNTYNANQKQPEPLKFPSSFNMIGPTPFTPSQPQISFLDINKQSQPQVGFPDNKQSTPQAYSPSFPVPQQQPQQQQQQQPQNIPASAPAPQQLLPQASVTFQPMSFQQAMPQRIVHNGMLNFI